MVSSLVFLPSSVDCSPINYEYIYVDLFAYHGGKSKILNKKIPCENVIHLETAHWIL
jgi:hypothetical protein